MCPDIEAYAPLVAGRRSGWPTSGRRAATRRTGCGSGWPTGRSQTNPLLAGRGRLLDLAGGRVTATEVLDLAGGEPVRRRFGFDDDDLDRLASGSTRPAIRWGLDAAHRAPFGLDGFAAEHLARRPRPGPARGRDGRARTPASLGDGAAAGRRRRAATSTWSAGSPSSSTGSARSSTQLPAAHRGRATGSPRCSARWSSLTARVADATPGSRRSSTGSWRRRDRRRRRRPAPGRRRRCCWPTSGRCWPHRLAGRPTRANFRTGTLTVCTMVPMRSVPHRVVCLLGLDDGVFPRSRAVDGDDVLARDPADRRARPAQRGPPADARRDPGRHREAGRSPTPAPTSTPAPSGRRRCRWASCSTRSTRTAGGDAVRDAGRRPASAAAVRRPQPHRRRARRAGAVQLRPGRAAPGRVAAARPADRPAAAARRAAAGRGRRTTSPSPTCRRSSRTRCGRSCASGSTSARRWRPRSRTTRSRSTLDGLEKWADRRPAAAPTSWPASTRRTSCAPSGCAACCRPGRSAATPWTRSSDQRDRPIAAAAARAGRATAQAVDVDVDLGGGRRLTGTVGAVCGDRLVARRATPAWRPSTGCGPGSTCSRSAPATPTRAGRRTPSAAPRRGTPRLALAAPSTTARRSWLRRAGRRSTTAACASRCRCR